MLCNLGTRATDPVFSPPVLEFTDITGFDLVYEFIAKIFSTIPAHFALIVKFLGLLGSEFDFLAQIAEIQVEHLLEPFATDWKTAFVTVAKVLIQLGRQLDGFGFIPGFQALADIGLAWKCDSALPDGGHGVGALIDDDTTVAQFSFGCGMKAHHCPPAVAESKQVWTGGSSLL